MQYTGKRNAVCSRQHTTMPSDFLLQCVTLVDYYAPLFFSHLSLEDADDFCKKVDVCGKHKFSSLPVKEDKCDLCHYVVDEVKVKLKDPDAKLEIIELLLKACDAVENYLKKAEFIFHIYLFIYKSRGTDLVDKVNQEEGYYFHHDQILNHKDYNGTCSLKCKTLVFEYGPLILTNAEKFLENTDIYNTLHACSSTIAETTSENLPNDKILMVTSSF